MCDVCLGSDTTEVGIWAAKARVINAWFTCADCSLPFYLPDTAFVTPEGTDTRCTHFQCPHCRSVFAFAPEALDVVRQAIRLDREGQEVDLGRLGFLGATRVAEVL